MTLKGQGSEKFEGNKIMALICKIQTCFHILMCHVDCTTQSHDSETGPYDTGGRTGLDEDGGSQLGPGSIETASKIPFWSHAKGNFFFRSSRSVKSPFSL